VLANPSTILPQIGADPFSASFGFAQKAINPASFQHLFALMNPDLGFGSGEINAPGSELNFIKSLYDQLMGVGGNAGYMDTAGLLNTLMGSGGANPNNLLGSILNTGTPGDRAAAFQNLLSAVTQFMPWLGPTLEQAAGASGLRYAGQPLAAGQEPQAFQNYLARQASMGGMPSAGGRG
jgi:hypothetical protein